MVVVQGGPTYGDVSGGPARLCSSRPLLLHNKREPQVVLPLLLFTERVRNRRGMSLGVCRGTHLTGSLFVKVLDLSRARKPGEQRRGVGIPQGPPPGKCSLPGMAYGEKPKLTVPVAWRVGRDGASLASVARPGGIPPNSMRRSASAVVLVTFTKLPLSFLGPIG